MAIKEFLQNNKLFITIISFFSLLRLYLGMNMPIWLFPRKAYDDMLMFEYSNLNMHFTNWNIQSLSKDISYPLFLCFIKLSQIPYRFWLSLLWIIAAILVAYGIYKFITNNRVIILGSFLFVLFLPVAFDVLCGQRIYRNAIITPSTIIFLSILYIFINNVLNDFNIRNSVLWGVLLGLTFTFNYYIKEDGILTLPILVVLTLAVLIIKLYEKRHILFSKKLKIILICIIPLMIFAGGTFAYKEVNNYYYGVSEINTRTSGEIGEFYGNLLKIDDSNKNIEIWIPASTVKKAFNASPTLKAHPELKKEWLNTPWNKDILKKSSIRGDLTAWSLRSALNNTGLYKDEKSANDFFLKVNNELDSAFKNGTLNKSDKIFITSSANGKDMDEIYDLTPNIIYGLMVTFFYNSIEFNTVDDTRTSLHISNNVTDNVTKDINDNLIMKSELDNMSDLDTIPMKLIELDLIIYKAISYIAVLLSFIGFIMLCVNQIQTRFENHTLNCLLLFNIMLFGTVLVQIFAVVWFCSYLGTNIWIGNLSSLMDHIKFHLVSTYGFFTMFVVLSIAGAFSIKDHIN